MKFIIILSLFISISHVSKFLAGVTIPGKYLYVEELFAKARLYKKIPNTLSELDHLEAEWMHFLVVRNETKPEWETCIAVIVQRLKELIVFPKA